MTNTVLGPISAVVASQLPNVFNVRELARNRPIMRSSARKRSTQKLEDAFDRRVDDLRPGAQVGYTLDANVPVGDTFLQRANDVRQNDKQFASSTSPGEPTQININPNADRAYFAHELGHIASQQTDVGHLVASLRANPKLKNALLGAMVTVPGVAAALEAGDDDMDTSIAMAALASAPALADEALATKNGLAIMDMAGQRATLGQRGKLAGGFLSYLAPAILAGTAGNAVGNMLDSDY